VTPYDRSLLIKTLLLGCVAILLAAGVVVLTDEAHSTLGMRVARLATMAPALAVVAQASTLALAGHRGERRALESLGRGPWGVARGAMLAAWALGALAVLVLLLPVSDVSSLFPKPPVSSGWIAHGDALLSPEHGIRVTREGAIGFATTSKDASAFMGPSRFHAVGVVLTLAVVLPAWLVVPQSTQSKAFVAASALALTLLLLHAVAAERIPGAALPLVAAPLLLQLGLELSRSRQRLRFFRTILGQDALRVRTGARD